MTLTPALQRNAVSGGMALGLILNKRVSLPHNKVAIDLSFEGAWESWPYRSKFPQVARDLANGTDGIVAMTRADEDKHTAGVLYWKVDGSSLRIATRDPDWAPDNPEDLAYAAKRIGEEVPMEGWRKLAKEFIDRFES